MKIKKYEKLETQKNKLLSKLAQAIEPTSLYLISTTC